MLMPSIFGENSLDDLLDYSFSNHKTFNMMNTDIRDTENGYKMTMNVPGVKKEDVKAEPRDGYLTIQATTDSSRDEKDSSRIYIRRECYIGSCSRSFYVGDTVTRGDIKAKFENDTLKMLVPKKEAKPAVEEEGHITIEG